MGVPFFGWAARKLFGTRNQRQVSRYLEKVEKVNAFEEEMRSLSDAELRDRTAEFRRRVKEEGAVGYDLIPEAFAVAREAMDRSVGIRNIFNPEAGFDPDTLPTEARTMYDAVKAEIDRTDDAPPEGEFLGCEEPIPAWRFVEIPPDLYQAVRELHPTSRPPFRARPFDVQLIGGTVLSEGRIAEMKTGEGKTIVATARLLSRVHRGEAGPRGHGERLPGAARPRLDLPVLPRPRADRGCDPSVPHAARGPQEGDVRMRRGLRHHQRVRLRLPPRQHEAPAEDQVQQRRQFAIVDEVDSILIDEARTPLIISGPAHSVRPRYELADGLARHLVEGQRDWTTADEKVQSCEVRISGLEGDIRNARDKAALPGLKAELEAAREELPRLESAREKHVQFFEVELDKKQASLTHEGITEAQRKAGVGSFYVGENIDLPHLLEQALRAHVVYVGDRDYVVAADDQGEMGVVIVDQNTGRKMVGRQWSDGLHQAVEAKEGVPIKDETQTMATITIQNFFKMYERLAGMTGTADTEATEFHEIYRLDVVSIPTNVPVERFDRNDLVYLNEGDKWHAIVEEVRRSWEVGLPVLVGTTSVERSEMLSRMLTKAHRIPHEVLNAKQHEREADIVQGAGGLGAVMIATNMAGRGTDIKLARFDRATLIEHWKKAGICSKDADASMSDDEVLARCWRQIAQRDLGLSRKDAEALDPAEARRRLLVTWAVELAWQDPAKAERMSVEDLEAALDASGTCRLHRLGFHDSVESMGGLHIIGTERHESRRIDNQLRGRAGRQGDNGSSRFFLSLEDDLMKMFAGKKTLYVLSKLGMKEGDAIEHPMLSRSVENAQRKVEERNFQIRKNILEYDEPMEHQRQAFYAIRQPALENKQIKERIFEYVEEATHDEAGRLLSADYRARCISEWIHENLGFLVEPERIRKKDREDLHALIRGDYLEEGSEVVANTCNEYLADDLEPAEWDVEGFARWAAKEYDAELDPEAIRTSGRREVIRMIEAAQVAKIEAFDLSPLDTYLVKDYGARELVKWANGKFDTEFESEIVTDVSSDEVAAERLLAAAREAYRRREIEYPIDYAVDLTTAGMPQDPRAALSQFCAWAKSRYELNWSSSALPSSDPKELRTLLVDQARKWDDAQDRGPGRRRGEGGRRRRVGARRVVPAGVPRRPDRGRTDRGRRRGA